MITKIAILGVGISQITKNGAVKTVDYWLSRHSGKSRCPLGRIQNRNESDFGFIPSIHPEGQARMTKLIVTPNPEMLVLAQKDSEFKKILNQADLAIPDGVGLLWASRQVADNSKQLTERVSGTDLMLDLCKLAADKGYSVGLLGAKRGVVQKTAEVLIKLFPGIKIKFALSELSELSLRGFILNGYHPEGTSETTDEAISKTKEMRLPRSAAYGGLARNDKISVDLLFVAFGAPKQENFLYSLISQIGPIRQIRFKVAMGVGGAFDLISGKIKRAPKFLQDLGLEWLWRLIQEPKRIKRIWTATVVFPWLVVKNFFKQPHSDVSSD